MKNKKYDETQAKLKCWPKYKNKISSTCHNIKTSEISHIIENNNFEYIARLLLASQQNIRESAETLNSIAYLWNWSRRQIHRLTATAVILSSNHSHLTLKLSQRNLQYHKGQTSSNAQRLRLISIRKFMLHALKATHRTYTSGQLHH